MIEKEAQSNQGGAEQDNLDQFVPVFLSSIFKIRN